MTTTEQERIDAAYSIWEQGDDIPMKELALLAYWEGYRLGYGVEQLDNMDYRMAVSQFSRWWNANEPDLEPEVEVTDGGGDVQRDLVKDIADDVTDNAETAYIPITAIDEASMPKYLSSDVSQAYWDNVRREVTTELRERGFSIV